MGKRVFDKADYYLRRGDRKRLARLLRKHRYLLNSQCSMLVYRAVWQFHGMLPWLLDQGVHPDCKMSCGDGTPLMHAAADGNLRAIELLLQHGADPDARNERNETPLGYACSYEQWQAARLLIDRGADVNGIEYEGRTYLDWLTLGQKEEGMRLLRSLGGRLHAELDPKSVSEEDSHPR